MPTVIQAADRHTAVTTGWTNPSNAFATTTDGSYATALPGKSATVDGDFGFPSLSLPTGAIILSVAIICDWKLSASVTGGILGIQGRNNSVADTAAEVTKTTLVEEFSTFTFGTLPSVTDLNTAGRVVGRLRCSKGSTNTALTGSVDYVYLQVVYRAVATTSDTLGTSDSVVAIKNPKSTADTLGTSDSVFAHSPFGARTAGGHDYLDITKTELGKNPTAQLTTPPRAVWKLDEAVSGGNFSGTDLTGNGHTASGTAASSLQFGQTTVPTGLTEGGTFLVGGRANNGESPGTTLLGNAQGPWGGSSPWSIAAIVGFVHGGSQVAHGRYFTFAVGAQAAIHNGLMEWDWGSDASATHWLYFNLVNSSGAVVLVGKVDVSSLLNSVTDNRPFLITMAYDGTRFKVNLGRAGQGMTQILDADLSAVTLASSAVFGALDSHFRGIASTWGTPTTEAHQASIGRVAVWDRALTSADVTDLYNSLAPSWDRLTFTDAAVKTHNFTAADTLGTSDSVFVTPGVPHLAAADSLGTSDSVSRAAQSPTRTTTDTLGTSDAATRAATVRARTTTDVLGTSDATTRAATAPLRTTADSLGTSDAATRAAAIRTRTTTDTLGTSDTVTKVGSYTRTTTDTLGTGDAATRAATVRTRAVADSLGTSDAATAIFTPGSTLYVRTTADTLGTSDAAVRAAINRLRTTTDVLGTLDSASRAGLDARTAADTLGTTDAAVRAASLRIRTATDALGTSDTATRVVVFARTSADSLGTSDVAARSTALRSRTSTDTLGTTDTAARAAQSFARAATDSLGTSDAATRTSTRTRISTDTLGTSDATTRAATVRARTTTDVLGTSDAATQAVALRARASTDTLGTNDVATRVVTYARTSADVIVFTDTAVRATATRARTAADALVFTDAAQAIHAHIVTASDTLGTTDGAIRAAYQRARSLADALVFTDAATRAASHAARASADTLGTSDLAARALITVRLVADTLGTHDSTTRAPYARTRIASDTLGTSDVVTYLYVAGRTTTDTLGTSDAASGVMVFSRLASDTLGTHDGVSTVVMLIPATVTITSGLTHTKISKITGYDLTTFTWGADLPFDEYVVGVVPAQNSPYSSATPIPALHGSVNVQGAAGPYSEASDIETTIEGADLELASAGDGDKIVRVFVRRGATWSGS